jgi:hypothetical protein
MKVQVLQETRVCIPLFSEVTGGPLWFHYDCRCAAEATLIARETQRELDRQEAHVKAIGKSEGEYCPRCKKCGRFK